MHTKFVLKKTEKCQYKLLSVEKKKTFRMLSYVHLRSALLVRSLMATFGIKFKRILVYILNNK